MLFKIFEDFLNSGLMFFCVCEVKEETKDLKNNESDIEANL